MKIIILGNNSAIPAHGRNPTAQIVELKDQLLLIDCGEGTQMQMIKYGIKRSKISYIFISHLHGDHYFGLIGLINSFGLLGRTDPLTVFCPQELPSIIQAQLDASRSVLPYQLNFEILKPEGEHRILIENAQLSVACFPVDHRICTHGFLITEKESKRKILPESCQDYEIPHYFYKQLQLGESYTRKDGTVIENELLTTKGKPDKKYAYCADTKYTLTFVEIIKGVDLVYHESTYLDSEIELANLRFHTTAKQAASLAVAAEAKQLLLGHYSSRYKNVEEFAIQARSVFSNVIASVEGMEINL